MIFDKNSCMLISAGGTDIFVAKFNSTGSVMWCRRAGRNSADSDDRANGIAYDPLQDAIFLTGKMKGGTGNTFPPLSINGAGNHDAFIARYNSSNGDCVWVKRIGGSAAIVTTSNGISYSNSTVCIVGTSNAVTLTVDTLPMPIGTGVNKIFVACFDSITSNLAWTSFGGNPNDDNYGNAIAMDAQGNTFVTGNFYTTCTFQTVTVPTNGGGNDAVVAKFSSSGTIQWVKAFGGPIDGDSGLALVADSTQSVFAVGLVSGNAQFGSYIKSGNLAQADLFVVHLKSLNGDVNWVSRSSGSGYTVDAKVITTDLANDVIIGGSIRGTMTINGASISSNGALNSDSLYATIKVLCSKCPGGKYYDSNATIYDVNLCKNCPGGKYSVTPGITKESECLPCIAGAYALPGSKECTLCPRGTFSALPGASSVASCQSCSAGTYTSSNGSISCSYCFAGTYSTGGAQACFLCPAGTFSGESNANSIASCKKCSVGSFSPFDGATTCQLCGPGTYNDQENKTLCNLCPQGTYTSSVRKFVTINV